MFKRRPRRQHANTVSRLPRAAINQIFVTTSPTFLRRNVGRAKSLFKFNRPLIGNRTFRATMIKVRILTRHTLTFRRHRRFLVGVRQLSSQNQAGPRFVGFMTLGRPAVGLITLNARQRRQRRALHHFTHVSNTNIVGHRIRTRMV